LTRGGQVPGAEDRGFDAVLDPRDPRGVLPQLAGSVADSQYDRRRAVGDRRNVVAPKGIGEETAV